MVAAALPVGIDATTGAALTGWEHVVQSVGIICATSFGERTMREYFGSFVPDALGMNITRANLAPLIASISSAIEQWEPRFQIVSVSLGGDAGEGELTINLTGYYRPRALSGDLSTEGSAQTLFFGVSGSVVQITG